MDANSCAKQSMNDGKRQVNASASPQSRADKFRQKESAKANLATWMISVVYTTP